MAGRDGELDMALQEARSIRQEPTPLARRMAKFHQATEAVRDFELNLVGSSDATGRFPIHLNGKEKTLEYRRLVARRDRATRELEEHP